MGKPTAEVIFTVLHAEGSLVKEVIRHLEVFTVEWIFCRQCPSSWLEAEITHDGAVYKQRSLKMGETSYNLEKIGSAPQV